MMTLLLIGVLIILLTMAFVLRHAFVNNKKRQAQLKAQQTRLSEKKKLLQHTIITQEKEKERIAKELDNKVGSKLNILQLFLHQLTKKIPNGHIDEMKEVLNETIDTSCRLSQELLPSALEYFDLASAIDELSDQFQQKNQLDVYFESDSESIAETSKLVKVQIFRIVQELMNNTLKYAQASQIHIKLWQNQEKLLLYYRDNGCGFDISLLEKQGGMGIKRIESRLQIINGIYDLKTAIGEGVQVRIEVENAFGMQE